MTESRPVRFSISFMHMLTFHLVLAAKRQEKNSPTHTMALTSAQNGSCPASVSPGHMLTLICSESRC